MKEMKESNSSWIGEIPLDWDFVKIKHALKERNENNSPVKTEYILSLLNDRGVIPYDEKGDIGNKSKENLEDYKLAYPGDIVLNSMNVIIGSVGLSKYFGAVSPVYYMLYNRFPNDDIRYFNYVFQTEQFQRSLIGYGNGILAHRMRIQMIKLNTVLIPYPNPEIQGAIVNYLDQKVEFIDSIIEKTKVSIEEYKKLKQSIITEAVTKGLNPDIKMKHSGVEWIGVIPEHWSVSYLKYLGSLQNGVSKGGEFFGTGLPFVSYSDVYKNYELPIIVDGLFESTEQDRENYSVKKGDVLFTRTSETIEEIGFTAVCTETIKDAVFGGFLIRFRPYRRNDLDDLYSKFYFRSEIHRRFFVKEMNIVTRASLSQELLKKLPVILPPIKEQVSIGVYLQEKCRLLDKQLLQKKNLISELEAYKKSHIYEIVTGKKEIE